MATRDFTAFLMKCVTKAFPDADLGRGSPVWTFLIHPVTEYVGSSALDLQTREFIKTVLRSKFPREELDKDGVIDDALIKPAEAILAPVTREIQQIRTRQTLADLRFHTIESISDIASNFGVVPRSGDFARGSVRLYYAAPTNERVVPETYVETTSGGLRFFASSAQSISAAQMALNQENDLYYWDIRVVSEKAGTVYNVKAGQITRAPTLSRVVRVLNLYGFSGGLARDTVETIAAELDSFPCTRSIGTRRGTVATIQALIGGARVVEMVGMGDIEMTRDIIRGGDVHPEVVRYGTGNPGSGSQGIAVPDGAADVRTSWMEDPSADFSALLGSSSAALDGYYLGMVWDTLSLFPEWAFSKISRILSTTRVEVRDRIIPVSLAGFGAGVIRWAVFPARLTLSDVPGGILWPDTPDGLVAIRDNEVHVGGCSDTFVLGAGVDSTSTSMDAVSDESLPGYGTAAGTYGYSEVILHDARETEILSYASVTRISAGLIEVPSCVWGVADFTRLEAGQVLHAPGLAPKQYFLIFRVGKAPGTNALRLFLDADVPATPFNARIIKRRMGLGRDACLRILPPSPNAGYYKILGESEGVSFDAAPGCLFRVKVTPTPAVVVSKQSWEITDTIDINLTSPKLLKVFGTDLNTFAGSTSVFSPTVDFSVYGVKKNDILLIDAGVDSSVPHILSRDPYGLGSRFLELTAPLQATSTVRFSVYTASKPIALPLVSVSKTSLLDREGSLLGLDVPYKDPLAVYTSEFTNLGSGVKHESADWTVGIVSVDGPAVDPVPPVAAPFDLGTYPFTLTVWHRQLGHSPIRSPSIGYVDGDMELREGGFIRPVTFTYAAGGPYDLGTSAGWNALVARLNDGIPADPLAPPYPFWAWEAREGLGGVQCGRLVCRPFGAALLLAACDNAWLPPPPAGPVIRFDPFLDYVASGELFVAGVAVLPNQVTSKDLYYGAYGTTDTDLKGLHPPLNVDQDIVDVYSGSNTNTKNMLMQIDPTHHRFRIRGRAGYHPEIGVSVRMGFPSSGVARLYFRDPTDIEVGGDTRLTVESGQVYWPDPLLNGPIVPGYPETEKPNDIYADTDYIGVGTVLLRSPLQPTFLSLGVMPGDILEISYKDIVGFGQDWSVTLIYTVVAPGEVLGIRHPGKPAVEVLFPAGVYDIDQLIDTINNASGEPIAIQMTYPAIPGSIFPALRWQEKIEVYGSATGTPGIFGLCSATNVSLDFGLWPILEPGYTSTHGLLVRGLMSLTEPEGSGVQFRILRPGTQRFSSMLMGTSVGAGGFYYVEGEFLSWGVGNQFNIGVGGKGVVGGHWSRGYYLTCENRELSYSMAEVPWLHVGNYFQTPSVSDDMFNDQAVTGGGLRLYYDRSPLVSSIQALETSREEKDTIQSALSRHLFPHYVSFTADYAGGALPAAVKPEILDLITGRDPGEPLDVSDIIGVLTQFGANKVDMPMTLAVLRHNEDRSQDLLIGDDRVETSRLTGFLPGNIVLNRRP